MLCTCVNTKLPSGAKIIDQAPGVAVDLRRIVVRGDEALHIRAAAPEDQVAANSRLSVCGSMSLRRSGWG